MMGVPLRIEVGKKEVANNSYKLVRRDSVDDQGVTFASVENMADVVTEALAAISESLYNHAKENLARRTSVCHNMDEVKSFDGLAKIMWCGSEDCEVAIKEATTRYDIDASTNKPKVDEFGKPVIKEKGMTIRCIPFDQEKLYDTCVCCGKSAEHMVLVGKSY
jgi:prolyl-tRNA synthetase